MTPARPGTFYTIAPERPFLDDLAAGIVARGADPEALAATTVLLPTRRSCRALRDAFLRVTEGRPTVLPRLLPLGDDDGDEIGLVGDGFDDDALGGDGALAIPPKIDPVRRLLVLAKMVRQRPPPMGDDQAVRLSAELARLIDQAAIERRPLSQLATLVPDEFARHWGITLEFLRILTEKWPAILQDEGAIDPAERRNRLLDARAQMWRANPPGHLVIAAGTTGSVPATAQLLGVIAGLPEGAVVLPGFDRALGPESLALLGPTHPQFGMATLLAKLGVGASAVRDWPQRVHEPATADRRAALRMRLQFVAAAIDPP
ncbi:MAG: double-strand break repair protein AddB, partial [Proteobacteria bacterium]|nr:double-strand break repair protein AddB [Pseudomonadota bacterium]